MRDLRALVVRNVVRSRGRYAGYLLACTLAVATFFTFGFFVAHPAVRSLVTKTYAGVVVQVLVLGQICVALFAAFFVLFFHRFLIRVRGKELGLLAALGMSPRQLARMVRWESAVLAGAALALGMLLSLGETYALFRLVGAVLDVPAPATRYSPAAVAYGLPFFAGVFALDAYLVGRSVRGAVPKQMLVSARRTQRVLRVSRPKVVGGAAGVAIGYALALGFRGAGPGATGALMLPAAALVVAGTYLLFSEGLTAGLGAVRRRTRSGLVLLSSSRLAHRVRDFARVLTVVTTLSAGVLALLGVAFGVLSHLQQMATSPAEHRQLLRVAGLLLFVFFFLAVLLLVAATSTLYVKLFTQLDEDRGQFAALRRLGVAGSGVRTMLTRELGLLFFAPALAGGAHAAVAMGEFTTKVAPPQLSQAGAWAAFGGVVAGFLALSALYFVAARARYQRALA